MPISTGSVGSMASVGSTDSRTRQKRYHLVKRTGADESLFGQPSKVTQMTGNRTWGGSNSPPVPTTSTTKKKCKTNEPEVVQVVTKDLIRKIRVPRTPDPSGVSVVLGSRDFVRINSAAGVLTAEGKRELEETLKREREGKQAAAAQRKKEMEQWELQRKNHENLSDLQQEKEEQRETLNAHANAVINEQDDEIKELNELILNAKCHAIRDLQLQEKQEVKKYMSEEENRLDVMMELERQKALKTYEQDQRQRQIEQLRGAEVIREQIKKQEQERLLEAERKDQETQAMLQHLERLQVEDIDKLQKKHVTQRQLMEEVSKCNEEIQVQKSRMRELEKNEDVKVMQYLKKKELREEELQKEVEKQKAEKEREIAKLRAQQERAKDKQAEKDNLRAKRNQEEAEREWRRKQKEAALKKAQTESMLREGREDQVQNKEHFLAMQAQTDRAEFERILKAQQDAITRDEKDQRRALDQRHHHASEVRRQVREKEDSRIQNRRNFFDEGIKLDKEARERQQRLNEIKQRKLEELRAVGIPEKYCAEVSRRITAPPPSFTMSKMS